VVAKKGPKFVAACQLAGSAILLALIPTAGSLGGTRAVYAMSALMLGMGIFQGPMSPTQSQISRDWMKEGVERAWAYRLLSLSHSSTPLLAAVMTPRLASRFGWRFVCYIYAAFAGGFTGIWLLLASDSPGQKQKQPTAQLTTGGDGSGVSTAETDAAAAAAKKKKSRPLFDWRIMVRKTHIFCAILYYKCHHFAKICSGQT
jgi:MFS family permease